MQTLDETTAAMVALAEAGIPADVQELLVRGDPERGIAPGAITKAMNIRPAVPVDGLETAALLNEAKYLAFTAISRMRAAHISCLDLTMQAEKLVGNIYTATRTRPTGGSNHGE